VVSDAFLAGPFFVKTQPQFGDTIVIVLQPFPEFGRRVEDS
jgi:hypothetical protein